MIIENIIPFRGINGEVAVIGNLLHQLNILLSENMVFGLGEGVSFIYWRMKRMNFPFLGGRIMADKIINNVVKNLNLKLIMEQTKSEAKAWNNAKTRIDNSIPVGLKVDWYYLDYYNTDVHFPAHYVTMYGYDDKFAYVMDTTEYGKQKIQLSNLELSRQKNGFMSSNHLSFVIEKADVIPQIKNVLPDVMKRTAKFFINPPIKNIGYYGIQKFAKESLSFFDICKNIEKELPAAAYRLEFGGTGGSNYRDLFMNFLLEANTYLQKETIDKAYELFRNSSIQWKEVSQLLDKAGKERKQEFLEKISKLLYNIAEVEKKAMEYLLK